MTGKCSRGCKPEKRSGKPATLYVTSRTRPAALTGGAVTPSERASAALSGGDAGARRSVNSAESPRNDANSSEPARISRSKLNHDLSHAPAPTHTDTLARHASSADQE